MGWKHPPKAPDIKPSNVVLAGLSFVEAYGIYRARMPLADVELAWRSGGYAMKINSIEVVLREGVSAPTTAEDAAKLVVRILRERVKKLNDILSQGQ